MPPDNSRSAPPKASAMIEALRGLGYSPATAIADIIDNSIAAKSTHIDVNFFWCGQESYIQIIDNGYGMNDECLEQAMRLGDKNPLDVREPDDLGRFGLGLKTASFSQCRSLTVASKKDERISCLRWDLDVLAGVSDGGWYLLEDPLPGSNYLLSGLNTMNSGTIVLLQKMDRIVTDGFTKQDFLNLIDVIEQHLSMVFHRYLEEPSLNLTISINGAPIKPWDPFMSRHPSTWNSPVEKIRTASGVIELQCHVLPHKDKLTAKEYEIEGGPNGWTGQQGFYVYRNLRLLVAGSWLKLGHGKAWMQEEPHRLARIRLDIPNSADAEWKIDIRKSIARPPVLVRHELQAFAEATRLRARRIFAHRGEIVRLKGVPIAQAWLAEHKKDGMRYRINQDHPSVKAVLENAGTQSDQVLIMLRIIEETIPVQKIWLDTAEGKETPRTGFANVASEEVRDILNTMYHIMVVQKGMSPEFARGQLLKTEPFHNFPELIADLVS